MGLNLGAQQLLRLEKIDSEKKDGDQTVCLIQVSFCGRFGKSRVSAKGRRDRFSPTLSMAASARPAPANISIETCQGSHFGGLSHFWSQNMGKAKSNTALADAETASNVTAISVGGGAEQNTPAAEAAGAERAAEAALVVFGRDDGNKSHASWFGAADAELATKAAGLMRFKILPITSDEHRMAASGLAAGRVFASGRCFSPFCREAAYGALEAFPEAFQPPAPLEPEPVPAPAVIDTPQAWETIGPGSLVLASMGDDTGWFESVVVDSRGDDLFVLRWQGWPDDPEFARRRHNLALLPAPPAETSASA